MPPKIARMSNTVLYVQYFKNVWLIHRLAHVGANRDIRNDARRVLRHALSKESLLREPRFKSFHRLYQTGLAISTFADSPMMHRMKLRECSKRILKELRQLRTAASGVLMPHVLQALETRTAYLHDRIGVEVDTATTLSVLCCGP